MPTAGNIYLQIVDTIKQAFHKVINEYNSGHERTRTLVALAKAELTIHRTIGACIPLALFITKWSTQLKLLQSSVYDNHYAIYFSFSLLIINQPFTSN